METHPYVAILVLNWNNYPDTRDCLESLKELTYPSTEIIVTDNGSRDNSLRLLQENFPGLTYLSSEVNLGFAGGNNLGLKYILDRKIPFTLLLNNDTEVVDPDFLDRLVEEILGDQTLGAVGPRVRRPNGNPDQVILPFPSIDNTIRTSLGLYHPDLNRKRYVDSIMGCCVLVRNEAVHQVGLLDEHYFIYVEETEWFFRMRKKDWKLLYIPIESVVHKGETSSRKLETKFVYQERRANVIYTLVKHRMILQAIITTVLMVMLLSGRIILSMFRQEHEKSQYSFSMIPELISTIFHKWRVASEQKL